MLGRRHSKLIRLEIMLFGLGCLGTVIFAWAMRPAIDTASGVPDGPYSFAVTRPDDLRYLEDMKMPLEISGETGDAASGIETPVAGAKPLVSESRVTLPELPDESVPLGNNEVNPYLDVD